MHDPSEKNLKHKTDVLAWRSVPRMRCELNFRPPEAAGLTMSIARAYSTLLLASGLGIAAAAFLALYILPSVAMSHPPAVLLGIAILTALFARIIYRLLERIGGTPHTFVSLHGLASAVLFIAALWIGTFVNSFACGVMLLAAVAIPSCLLMADQMAGHMVHWFSADPRMERDAMVHWRNAWCGRFMTRQVDRLRTLGASEKASSTLKRYPLSHVMVGTAVAVSLFAGILIAGIHDINQVGLVIALCLTGLLVMLAVRTHAQTLAAVPAIRAALGHWFEYQKDQRNPPWVLQSPAGSQPSRAFAVCAVTALFAAALALLTFSDASAPPRTVGGFANATPSELLLVLLTAVVLSPVQVLLIVFIVTAPVVATCREAIEEQDS